MAHPNPPATPNPAYAAIDAYVAREMRRLRIPGVALAIVEDDRIVHMRGIGQARPHGEPPTSQTPFLVGSLTKSFTALAILQLAEAGKIDLDAPVPRYLPWFRVAGPQASARVTVRHLLNQTSGLPGSAGELILADFDARPGATERQARALATVALNHPPGTAFEYSNSNYQLLGLILEATSGETYAGYVHQHICAPLRMDHTAVAQVTPQAPGLAVGHRLWFGFPVAAPHVPFPPGAVPGGGLISTAEDMARYMIALLDGGRYAGGQLLSSAGIAELLRGVADNKVFGMALGQYGMGWFVDTLGQAKLAWHGGTLPNFGAHMALLPEQQRGIVLLFNACHHWYNPVLAEVGTAAAALLAGEQATPVPFVGLIPTLLRGQLLVPALPAAGVVATLRLLAGWRRHPERRLAGAGEAGRTVLLPLIPNLLVALALVPLLGRRRGYLRLYMPDYTALALACGSFALAWSLVRTGLVLRALRQPAPSPAPAAES